MFDREKVASQYIYLFIHLLGYVIVEFSFLGADGKINRK